MNHEVGEDDRHTHFRRKFIEELAEWVETKRRKDIRKGKRVTHILVRISIPFY